MKNKRNVVLTFVLLSLTIALTACGTKKLDGDYIGKVNLLFTEISPTLRFKGDKVIEIDEDGSEENEASYKITDNQLDITFSDDNTVTAELSKDKKSFIVSQSSIPFLKDVKFIKQEK